MLSGVATAGEHRVNSTVVRIKNDDAKWDNVDRWFIETERRRPGCGRSYSARIMEEGEKFRGKDRGEQSLVKRSPIEHLEGTFLVNECRSPKRVMKKSEVLGGFS